jgi:hypothetical protein
MNTYVIILSGYDRPAIAYGETSGKAKYNFYLEIGDLFGDVEQFERMKKYRNIPFVLMGMSVILKSGSRGNIKGTIVGSNDSMNLNICFDGTCHKGNCHTHYELNYLDNNGKVVAEY